MGYNDPYYGNNQNYNNPYYNDQNYNQQNYNQQNYQPYNPNPNNQNQKPNNKNKNKTTMIIIIAVVAVLVIGIILFFVLNNKGTEEEKKEDPPVVNTDYMVIGNDNVCGYLTIPSDWTNSITGYDDEKPDNEIQYAGTTDDGKYIVTLACSNASVEYVAEAITTELNNRRSENVTVSEDTIAGTTALKIIGYNSKYFENDKDPEARWMIFWIFRTGDKTHAIGIEGPNPNNDSFLIPYTFKEKKEK